ncbi:hypothetical protein PFICI_05703 [Pestalotiopsis fici W106-1]|uniref:tRNA-splicing endonuclease subunit Sen34 n=1 Tax=Pestalotiopsis fici (strain W106-1 / CGMCC3.15140) TaxID=1229662 RepID=W3XEK2_PESFW|nr:uncharacterized protein PFICI_05703 [Pestalotiopsis fici W106-1]ETS83827.1 hypothetical protein PFICI_05703 [Pestalotiopsis fici W106-1]
MASDSSRSPVRISKVTDRYLLFDIDDIMYLRRHHNICSPFVGTMPQAPSQSVFMGLPIELMAEEAMVLVRKKAAYVVDDAAFHPSRLASPDPAVRAAYLQAMKQDGLGAATAAREYAEFRKVQGLNKAKAKGKKAQKTKEDTSSITSAGAVTSSKEPDNAAAEAAASVDEELNLFDSSDSQVTKQANKPKASVAAIEPFAITPVTSGALMDPPPSVDEEEDTASLVDAPRGYPLYAHLHDHGYYMMPGLRFGCDYNVYPGDPLRYHSHFQATHYGWNDEIKLLDIVGGGRLGTNVKKAYLIGGATAGEGKTSGEVVGGHGVKATSATGPPVRAFSIEWAAM